MSDLTPTQSEQSAIDDLEAIKALRRYEPFARYFLRRLKEEQDKQAARVLDGDYSPEQLLIEQRIYKTMRDTLKLIDNDEAACRKIVEP